MRNLSTSAFLLGILIVIVCGIYPFALWCIAQAAFPFQANGSMLQTNDGKIIGSKLIAQQFTQDQYFHPRPSAAGYDASASSSSALAPSNYALRNRIARQLGPIVQDTNDQLIGPEIEKWLQQDKYMGAPGIVAQWAMAHKILAQAWVNADPTHNAFVATWAMQHPDLIAQFIRDNSGMRNPKPADYAVIFFQDFSKNNPGKFPLSNSADIQSIFFDMWREENNTITLKKVPADMVTTSASGLDPHITLQNAFFQLSRVVLAWANRLKRDPNVIEVEIREILEGNAQAPLAGLAGEAYINVLEVNLELNNKYADN